jgi:hypothetical protein
MPLTDVWYLAAGDQMIMTCFSNSGVRGPAVEHASLTAVLVDGPDSAATLQNAKIKAQSEIHPLASVRSAPRQEGSGKHDPAP